MSDPQLLDFAALRAISAPLADFVNEPRMVTGFAGPHGVFVVFRPYDDEDLHICTMRAAPARVLRQREVERDANWGARQTAVAVAYALASGVFTPVLDGAHLIATGQDRDRALAAAALKARDDAKFRSVYDGGDAPPPVTMKPIDLAALQTISPRLARYVGERMGPGFTGPGGTYAVYNAVTKNTLVVTDRNDEVTVVFHQDGEDLRPHWNDPQRAALVARLLAAGTVTPSTTGIDDQHLLVHQHQLEPTALTLDDLADYPLLASFLRRDDELRSAYEGEGGVYMVALATKVGEYDLQQRYLILTVHGDTREIVWLYLEPDTTSWHDEGQADRVARALAAGEIAPTRSDRDEWIVDEFAADPYV